MQIDEIILDDNGKDDRLVLLENGMTKYGCKTKPYNHISYSSCTASNIHLETYIYLQNYYKNIDLNNQKVYIEEFQSIRDDLRKIIGLKDDIDICLSPSGTDLEMLPYLFIPKGSKVTNIIIGPNEVGSGTLLAAKGCVFSNISSQYSLKKGDQLEGFENFDINIINLPIRGLDENPIEESILLKDISNILNQNENTYKIVHSVYHSKTGLIKPLPTNLLEITKKYKNTIVVIDACQFRISRNTINTLLDYNCIVFITGSKFFAAPTFSAAALIPPKIRDIAAYNTNIPDGLNFLYGKELFPYRWKSVHHFQYGNNQGLLLRWKAAIFEMQLFNSISEERIKNTINIFNQCIQKLSIKYQNSIDIYSTVLSNENDYDLLMSHTIVTIGFVDKTINIDHAKTIYQQLIDNTQFKYKIHLGQPVKIKKLNNQWLGTLRIALNSKFFVNYSGKVSSIQRDIILQELDYIFDAIIKLSRKL